MIDGKPSNTLAHQLQAAPAEIPIVVPARRSRHAVIANDIYTYHRYRTWMHSLRQEWQKK